MKTCNKTINRKETEMRVKILKAGYLLGFADCEAGRVLLPDDQEFKDELYNRGLYATEDV